MYKEKPIVINYQDVKDYIYNSCKWATHKNYSVEAVLNAVEPFAMDYITLPVGFAETDNLNDIDKLIRELDNSFMSFMLDDGRKVRSHIKFIVKIETERWKERNAWFYGRHIGRLAYLLNNLVLEKTKGMVMTEDGLDVMAKYKNHNQPVNQEKAREINSEHLTELLKRMGI
jgi:hypothetical protein